MLQSPKVQVLQPNKEPGTKKLVYYLLNRAKGVFGHFHVIN